MSSIHGRHLKTKKIYGGFLPFYTIEEKFIENDAVVRRNNCSIKGKVPLLAVDTVDISSLKLIRTTRAYVELTNKVIEVLFRKEEEAMKQIYVI